MSLIQLFILQFLRSTKLSKVKILNAVQSLYALVQLIPLKITTGIYIFMNSIFNSKELPEPPPPQTQKNEEIDPSIEITI